MTNIINKNHSLHYDVYIGRGSIFGNPYIVGRDGTRDEVIKKYGEWFNFLLRDKIFKQEVLKLKNKTLGCFCKPLKCHGDIIVDWLNKYV